MTLILGTLLLLLGEQLTWQLCTFKSYGNCVCNQLLQTNKPASFSQVHLGTFPRIFFQSKSQFQPSSLPVFSACMHLSYLNVSSCYQLQTHFQPSIEQGKAEPSDFKPHYSQVYLTNALVSTQNKAFKKQLFKAPFFVHSKEYDITSKTKQENKLTVF